MRVYVPLTMPALARTHQTGELDPVPEQAYAVTQELREWCGTQDSEELEYAALELAAWAALRRLATEADAGRRRVVLAVELPDAQVSVGEAGRQAASGGETPRGAAQQAQEPGVVRVVGPVPLARIAAVHVDEAQAERDVAAVADRYAAGESVEESVGDLSGTHELLWYATQEIPQLLD